MRTAINLGSELDRAFWADPDRFVALADNARVTLDDIFWLVEAFASIHLSECPYVKGGKIDNGEEVALDIFVNNFNERVAVRVLQRTIEKLIEAATTESTDSMIQKLDAHYRRRLALVENTNTYSKKRKRRTKIAKPLLQ